VGGGNGGGGVKGCIMYMMDIMGLYIDIRLWDMNGGDDELCIVAV
jgi:hypothetical protein